LLGGGRYNPRIPAMVNCESLKELGDIEVKCFRATWTHSFGRPPAGIIGLIL
jgi:hypothetical protein